MLPGFRNKAARGVAPRPPPAETIDYNARAAAIVHKAREKLQICAALPENAGPVKIVNAQSKIGGPEATGVVIRIASAELDAQGHVTPDALARLEVEARDVMRVPRKSNPAPAAAIC